MACKRYDLERQTFDFNRPVVVHLVHGRCLREHEVGPHRVERISATVEKGGLEDGVAEDGLIEGRGVDQGSGALDDESVAAEMIRVPVGRYDGDDLAA